MNCKIILFTIISSSKFLSMRDTTTSSSPASERNHRRLVDPNDHKVVLDRRNNPIFIKENSEISYAFFAGAV